MTLPKAFRRLWWAAGVDNLGTGAFTAAVPLLTVTVTHDPRLVSLVSAAAYLPWLVLSLPAGALADRHDRAGLMWRAQAVQAALVAVTAVLAACGAAGVPILVVTAFGLGAGEVVFTTAAQAILPDLVAPALLPRANGRQQAVTTVTEQFAGPPLGGLLFGVAAALPFALDAVSFAFSAVLVAKLPRRAHVVRTRAGVREGLRWLWRHRLLRTLAILVGVNTFCGRLAAATLVLLATQVVHLDARGYGLLLAGAALGSVLGGLVNARVVNRIGARAALLASLAGNVGAFAGVGLSRDPVVLGGFLAVTGFVTTLWNIVTVGLRQQFVPAELLGRVTSAYRLLGWGLIPVGTLAGGLVAQQLGPRAPYLVAAVVRGVALVVALPVLVGPLWTRQRRV
ncbi:Predicted arabinose efflux permease, MFS family [Amycolatopsis pretoriensis]|uniref:Predicted arabinose efflux permease, MFS family n=1 Tax=Amycolatopsis pretoriensis TaxID=218821 RepID=A0A1H5QBS3_9PSEU|nr:MFS transporter [Amycolatopsis pretoriensis]SEF23593.1 Predicted arabinose efflux permease, MFS family [Amycolatopsis pretoriensis]